MHNNTKVIQNLVEKFFQKSDDSEVLNSLQTELKKNYDVFISNYSKEDMIKLLNKISAQYIEIGIKHQGKEHEDIFSKIRSHFYKSDKIEINENRTILLKGFYYFFQNDFKRAQDHFFNANNTKTDTLPYLCGKGFIEYWKKNYTKAISYFKQIFLYYRKSFPEVYYLLGICFFKLNQLDLAEVCFKYLLKKQYLNQSTVSASLAIVYLLKKDFENFYKMIQLGYTQTQKDVNLVLNLAKHYFYKNEFERCEKVAKLALQLTENFSFIFDSKKQQFDDQLLKAEIFYLLGYVEQQKNTKEGYDQAYRFYNISLENNKEYYPTMFGLGQIYFYQKNYVQAMQCFENIIKQNPDNNCRECYLILPHIYMRLQQKEKVITTFEKALFFFPNDLQLKIDFCSYLEIFNQKKCLKIYTEIYEQYINQNLKEQCSIQLLNNMTVIFTINKQYERSKRIMKNALMMLEEKKHEMDEIEYEGTKNILLFNKTFYLQKTGQFFEAKKLLLNIVDSSPGFIECYLQLSKLYQRQKDLETAQFNTDKALFVCSKIPQIKNADQIINLKLLQYIKSKNFHKAFQLVNITKSDEICYQLFKGALYYYYVVYNRDQIQKSKKYMQASAELCRKILMNKLYRSNYKAANLVACLLAERGRFSESIYIFSQIQDQIKKGDSVILNIALCEFLRQNYEKSKIVLESPLSSYKIQQSKLYPIVLTQLEKFDLASKKWKYQLLRNPNLENQFNLASFYKQKAHILFKRDLKKVDQLKKILKLLKFSKNTFKIVMNNISNDNFKSFSDDLNPQEIKRQRLVRIKKSANKQLSYLQRNQEPFESIIKKEEEKIELRKNSKEQRMKIIQQRKLAIQQKQLEEEIKRKQKQEMLEKKAQENMNKIDGFQFKWGEKKEKKKKSVVEKVMDEDRRHRKQKNLKRNKNQDLQEGDQQLIRGIDNSSSDDEQEYDPLNLQYDQDNKQEEEKKVNQNEDMNQQKEEIKKVRDNLYDEMVPKKRRGMILSDDEDDQFINKNYFKNF